VPRILESSSPARWPAGGNPDLLMDPLDAEARLDWLHFIRKTGDDGRRWAEAYAQHRNVAHLCDEALTLLRRRRTAEGRALLEAAGRARAALADAAPSIRSVMDRWYYGVLGYYLYTVDAYDQADQVMRQAADAVADAVGREPFLLPLAYHCHEFYLHRARIARNRMRWVEMREYVDEVRGMMESRVPLCSLADGTAVTVGDVQGFYRAFEPLTDEERAGCRTLVEDGALMAGFDRFVRTMYRVPWAVIPYP
jgi:hypothetical protein